MEHLENLSPYERQELLSFPAYISLLAATHDGEMDEIEKQAAIKLTHLKTFTSDEFLNGYYKEVEKDFSAHVDVLYHALPQDAASREIALRQKLSAIETLTSKLPAEYSHKLLHSLESYSWHVAQSHRNVSEDFLIPFKIKGLTS